MGMIVRWGLGTAAAFAVWSLASACSSSSGSGGYTPPPGPTANDPGCRVIGVTPPSLAGSVLDVVHEALPPSDAGDAGDAGADPGDAAAPADAGAPDATTTPTIAAADIRTIACRDGTTLDVAAGPNGGAVVVGAGIRAQVVTFGDDSPSTRNVDYLQSKSAVARVATLADGRLLLIGMATEQGELVTEEGTNGPVPVGPRSAVTQLGPVSTNAAGTVFVTTSGDDALLRTASGTTNIVPIAKPSGGGLGGRTRVGLGNDDRPFRVAAEGIASVQLADRSVAIDGIVSLRGVAFTTVAASEPLPLLALVHGDSRDAALNAFDVAVPAGQGYVRIRVAELPTPCAREPSCTNTCEEQNIEVDPKEVAATWDGTRAWVAFVRRSVVRTRRYRIIQASGVLCDVFGCDPGCGTESSGTTKSAELVIAAVDLEARTVREAFSQPLEVSNGSSSPSIAWSGGAGQTELAAHARDGFLHVTFAGKYQGSFPAVALFRFRLGP
jgi:hypothetical protein